MNENMKNMMNELRTLFPLNFGDRFSGLEVVVLDSNGFKYGRDIQFVESLVSEVRIYYKSSHIYINKINYERNWFELETDESGAIDLEDIETIGRIIRIIGRYLNEAVYGI